MSKELIVSSTSHETKVAILEEDQVVEVYFEREQEYSLAGSIFKGRVTRVLPGMQSAFVNIGLERDAFLYVSDFFEDTEEYDALVSATEDKVARMEREGREAREGARIAVVEPEAVAVSVSPGVVAEPLAAPSGAAPGPVPAPPPADRDNRDRHHRRRRRRGRDRGFPESKYGGAGSQRPEPPLPAAPEPASSAAPVAEIEAEPAEAAVHYEPRHEARPVPVILPGESLAKYRDLVAPAPSVEPIAEPAAEPLAAEPVAEAHVEPVVEAAAEPIVEAHVEPIPGAAPETVVEPEPVSEPEPVIESVVIVEETIDLAVEQSDELSLPEDDLSAEGTSEDIPVEEFGEGGELTDALEAEEAGDAQAGDAQADPTAEVAMRGPAPERRYAQPGRRNRRRGRDNRGDQRPGRPGAAPAAGPGRPESRPTRGQPLIGELLKEGQEIIVQIAKEPIGTKGARITSHLALPGRYLVYMPTVDHVGVSRRISSDEERQRLKRMLTEFRRSVNMPGGFIVRTAAEGRSDEDLRADMRFLFNLWKEQRAEAERKSAPALLHRDLNLVERILRDQISAGFSAIWVDDETEYAKIVEFVQLSAPALSGRVKLYTKDTPIFEEFGVQEQINNAMKSKVWLKSGGSIVINQTEALVAIDVNTGKYVGKTQRLEDTIVKTNVDAIKEIVRQIRLRDLGGIIVIDFIDMDERKNRQRVMQALEEALRADRAPSKALAFNDFGLVAITRKRVKQPLEKALGCSCPYCAGAGYVKSPQTVSLEILAEAKKMVPTLERNTVTIRANPEVARYLKQPKVGVVAEIEEIAKRPVMVKSDVNLHQENFDIQ